MLVRRVIDDKVQDEPDVVLLSLRDHVVEVRQRPVHRIDVLVVRHVVAKIHLWRGEAGADPDRVDAQIMQVRHLLRYARQIADSVIIAVREAARIQFVKYSMLPPLVALGIH